MNFKIAILRSLYASTIVSCITIAYSQDLSTFSPDSIKAILQPSTPRLNNILLEIGRTRRTELIPSITNFLQSNKKLKSKTTWSAHLALARLGDANALHYVLQRVQRLGVNDDVVYELFPDLTYTRQRQAFNYLIQVIGSNEKNCRSADPENPEPINCAYRILEFIAPVIKNFPVKVDASGDLEVHDYEEALRQVRSWFALNPDYEIIVI